MAVATTFAEPIPFRCVRAVRADLADLATCDFERVATDGSGRSGNGVACDSGGADQADEKKAREGGKARPQKLRGHENVSMGSSP